MHGWMGKLLYVDLGTSKITQTSVQPYAEKYLETYHDSIAKAESLLSNTQGTALADRIAGQLFKPGSLLALLFLL